MDKEEVVSIPQNAVGFILLESGSLFAFGILPPTVEAKVVPGVEEWKEIKICPPSDVLALPATKAPTCQADYCKAKIKSHEAHGRKHLSLILEEQGKVSRTRLNEGNCDLPSSLKMQYYCNRTMCYSGRQLLDQSRGFRKMKYLRQHYLKLHAPKTFACSSCGKSFSTLGLLGGHMKNCGNLFECSTCQKQYTTLEALQTHCRRNDHSTDYSKYKVVIDNAKHEVSALREADKKKNSDTGGAEPIPVQVITPRPKTITCGPSGTPNHVIWTYDTGVEAPKVKSEAGTQTETDVDKPSSSNSYTPIHTSSRGARRKRSAETQTGKVKQKVSTGAQTLNVTKRRRTSKKHIAEAETQCCHAIPPGVSVEEGYGSNVIEHNSGSSHVIHVNLPGSSLQCQSKVEETSLQVLMSLVGIDGNSLSSPSEPEPMQIDTHPMVVNVLDDGMTPTSSQGVTTSEVCVGFDHVTIIDDILQLEELTRETQTESSFDFEYPDLLEQSNLTPILNLVTTETQTSFILPDSSGLSNMNFLSSSTDWGDITPLPSETLSEELSLRANANPNSPSYLVTMDGETQTFPEDYPTLKDFLLSSIYSPQEKSEIMNNMQP